LTEQDAYVHPGEDWEEDTDDGDDGDRDFVLAEMSAYAQDNYCRWIDEQEALGVSPVEFSRGAIEVLIDRAMADLPAYWLETMPETRSVMQKHIEDLIGAAGEAVV
jgi:hypothetical protein